MGICLSSINKKSFLVLGAAVSYVCLQYINNDEIKEAIPPIGLRVLFRVRLTEWREVHIGIILCYLKLCNF